MGKLVIKISFLFMFFVGSAQAVIINTASDGTWNVTTIEGTFDDNSTTLMDQVWWGDEALAIEFAALVGTQLGYPNYYGNDGPYFAFQDSGLRTTVTGFTQSPNGLFLSNVAHDLRYTYAVAEIVNVPEPSVLALIVLGFAGMGFSRRKAKKD